MNRVACSVASGMDNFIWLNYTYCRRQEQSELFLHVHILWYNHYMKLYLSSYQFGDDPQKLADLFTGNKGVAIVPNALDPYTDTVRREANLKQEMDGLQNIGLTPGILDLRKYFGKPDELQEIIAGYNGVWVVGGNTFTLRKAYRETGFDSWLYENRENRNFVYAGYSAGICLLAPSLKGLEIVDDPNIVAEGYRPGIIWPGVGLIDFAIAPHYQSNHPESEAVNRLVEYFKREKINYKALHDGEVIVLGLNDNI